MKINAEVFLENFDKYDLTNTAMLVSGNEPSLISKIESIVIKKLKSLGGNEPETVDSKTLKNFDIESFLGSDTLFSKFNILLLKNANEAALKAIDKFEIENATIVLSGENIKGSSKTKAFFDRHKLFYSIGCYKLSKEFKKKTIDRFVHKNKIEIEKDARWYLFENSSDEYLLLEKELEKMLNYGQEKINIDNIGKLLNNKSRMQLDELFFQCVIGSNKSILKYSEGAIKTNSEAYGFLQVVKNFSKILTDIESIKEKQTIRELVDTFLPKYLFKQKDSFQITIKKCNVEKIVAINALLQKTELFLRKNEENFLIIIQRFMFNCLRILK